MSLCAVDQSFISHSPLVKPRRLTKVSGENSNQLFVSLIQSIRKPPLSQACLAGTTMAVAIAAADVDDDDQDDEEANNRAAGAV